MKLRREFQIFPHGGEADLRRKLQFDNFSGVHTRRGGKGSCRVRSVTRRLLQRGADGETSESKTRQIEVTHELQGESAPSTDGKRRSLEKFARRDQRVV